MSTNEKQPVAQVSAGRALREILTDPKKASIIAVGLFVLALFLPVVSVTGVPFAGPMAIGMNGIEAMGMFAWLMLAALVAAAASRFAAPLARFGFLLDVAAVVCWAIGLYLAYQGMTTTGMPDVDRMVLKHMSFSPAIGTLPLALSLLFTLRAMQLSRKQGYLTT